MRIGIFYKQDSQNIQFCGWRKIKDDNNHLKYTLHFIRGRLPEWKDSLMKTAERFQEVLDPIKFFRLKLVHNSDENRIMELVVYSDDRDKSKVTLTEETIFRIVDVIFDGHSEFVRQLLKNL